MSNSSSLFERARSMRFRLRERVRRVRSRAARWLERRQPNIDFSLEAFEPRLMLSGDLDALWPNVRALADLDDGSVAAVLDIDSGDFEVARLDADGNLDASFGQGGRLTIDINDTWDLATSIEVDNEGAFIVGGFSGDTLGYGDLAYVRVLPDGTLDLDYGDGGQIIVDPTAATGEPTSGETEGGTSGIASGPVFGPVATYESLSYSSFGVFEPFDPFGGFGGTSYLMSGSSLVIIDNGDTGYTESGSGWTSGTNSSAYDGDDRFNLKGTGSDKAEWSFTSVTEGWQEVYITWPAISTNAVDAPFSIYDGDSSTGTLIGTIDVNQTIAPDDYDDGSQWWRFLGVFEITSGTLTVKLTDQFDAGTYAVADAVAYAEASGAPDPIDYIDDGDIGFTQTSTWLAAANSSAVDASYRRDAVNYNGAGVTWLFTDVPDDLQEVFVTWPQASNNAANALYKVYDSTTLVGTLRINQQNAPTGDPDADGIRWQSLGVFDISSGQLKVAVSDDGGPGTYLIADAARYEAGTLPPAPTQIDDGDLTYAEGPSYIAWETVVNASAIDGTYRREVVNNIAGWATWTFSDVPNGLQEVFVTWLAASNNAGNARYNIYDGTTERGMVRINQQNAPSGDPDSNGIRWQSLGVFDISSGQLQIKVTDDNGPGTYLIADAARYESGTLPPAPTRIDDGDLAYSENSGWSTGAASSVVDHTYRYRPVINQGSTATWTFSDVSSGLQEVFVTWPQFSNNAADALYRVYDNTTIVGTLRLNQQNAPAGDPDSEGIKWQSLGFFDITSGQLKVTLFDNGGPGTNLIADAVRYEAGTLPPAPTQIDDGEQAYSENWGWTTGVDASAVDHSYRYRAAISQGSTATWTFGDVPNGLQEVFITWPVLTTNASKAPFKVYDNTTLLGTVYVDQRYAPTDVTDQNGVSWHSLGIFSFMSGTIKLNLVDSGATGTNLIADAARYDTMGDESGVEIIVTTGTSHVNDDASTVDFGFASYSVPVQKTFTVWNDGADDLTLGSLSVPDGFSIVSNFGSTTVTSGGSTTFTIQYDANSPAAVSGEVSFTTNDSDENPFNFTVQGNIGGIIDDGESGFTKSSGWSDSTISGFRGDLRYAAAGTGSKNATWAFSGLTPGTYSVSATWTANANRATNAPFTIFDGYTSIDTVTVNQVPAPVGDFTAEATNFQELGQFTIFGNLLRVQLADAANGYVIADGVRVELIEKLPTVSIEATTATTDEDSASPAIFTVTRADGVTDHDLTVYYSVSGSATSGEDYESLSGSVVIPMGETSAEIEVTAIDDTLYEGNETVRVTLVADGDPYLLDSQATDVVTIVEDEPAGSALLSGAVYVDEGDEYTLTITPTGFAVVSATIDWGDGTTPAAVSGDGPYTHTYADGPDFHLISATVLGDNGATYVASASLAVPGALDETFDGDSGTGNGKVTVASQGYPYHVDSAIDDQGRIVVVSDDSSGDFVVRRFLASGEIDTTFNSGNAVIIDFDSDWDGAGAVAIDSMGRIIVVGYATSSSTYSYDAAVVRLLSDGSVDTTFGASSIPGAGKVMIDRGGWDYAYDVAVDASDRILFLATNNSGMIDMVRLTADGDLDDTFDGASAGDGIIATGLYSYWYNAAVAVQSSGRIVVGGGDSTDAQLLGFDDDGNLDSQFGGTFDLGASYDEWITGIQVLDDDSLAAVADAMDGDLHALRFTAEGALNTSFGGGHITLDADGGYDTARSITQQRDGKFVIAGVTYDTSTYDYDFALARLNADGSLDTTFGPGETTPGIVTTAFSSGSYDDAYTVHATEDGRLLAVGYSDMSLALARYESAMSDLAVTVDNAAPGIELLGDSTGNTEIAYDLDIDVLDPGADGVTLTVDWGDGNVDSDITSSGAELISVSHAYLTGGEMTITVTATDEDNATTIETLPISITQQSISIDDVTVTEGDSGEVMAVFTATLAVAPSSTLTVDYSTGDVTAEAGSDYEAVSGQLVFAQGETTKQIQVPVYGDELIGADETFAVLLTNLSRGVLQKDTGIGTIETDDGAIEFSIDGASSAVAGDVYSVDFTTNNTDTTVGYYEVDWGDGRMSNFDLRSSLGTHVYLAGGATDTVEATLHAADTPVEADSIEVTVSYPTPILNDTTFAVAENALEDTYVGSIAAVNNGANGPLTYAITGGTGASIFEIDAATGRITVSESDTIDFETDSSFDLTIEVSDNSSTPLTDTATVVIDVIDIDESAQDEGLMLSVLKDGSFVPITEVNNVLDFGVITTGASETRLVRIDNLDDQAVELGDLGLGEGFSLGTTVMGVTLGAYESLVVEIAFDALVDSTPTAGTYGATASLMDDAENVVATFDLFGVARAGTPQLELSLGTTIIDHGGEVVNFGNLELNESDTGLTNRVFLLRNTGNGDLVVDAAPIDVPDGFTIVSGLVNSTIAPGEVGVMIIALDTSASGVFHGEFSIDSNDAQLGRLGVGVFGSVETPEIAVSEGVLVVDDTTGLLDFGSTSVGTPVTKTLTLTNVGSADLTLFALPILPDGYTLTLAGGGAFVGAILGTDTGVDDSIELDITFDPETTGPFDGWLALRHDGLPDNVFNIQLTGNVAAPEANILIDGPAITVDLTELDQVADFGAVPWGVDLVSVITLENNGATELTLSTVDLPDGFKLASTFAGLTIAGSGGTETLEVIYDSKQLGLSTGTITFNASTPEDAVSFTVQAMATLGSTIDFGSVEAEVDADFEFTITNDGAADLELTAPTDLPDGFTISGGFTPTTLSPGYSMTFTATLNHTDAGHFAGTIVIPTNDPVVGDIQLPVAGDVGLAGLSVTESLVGALVADASLLDFGTTAVGNDVARSFTLTNTGTADLSVTDIVLPSGFTTDFEATVIEGGGFLIVAITLDATTVGEYGDIVSVQTANEEVDDIEFSVLGSVADLDDQPDTLTLLNDTGTDPMDGITSDPTLVGTLVASTPQGVLIEFDHDGDGAADGATFADAAGRFIYRPAGLSVATYATSDVFEDNDTLTDAGQIALGVNSSSLTLMGEIGDGVQEDEDVDIYWFTAADGDVLTFDIDAATMSSSLDSFLRLFDETGYQLASNDDDGTTTDSYLQYTIQDDGIYYIAVSSSANSSYDPHTSGTGTSGSTGDYELVITSDAPAQGQHTIRARASITNEVLDQTFVSSSWAEISFTLWADENPDAANQSAELDVESLALVNDNGSEPDDLVTTDPTVTGEVTNDGSVEGLVVEFDYDGDGYADASTTTDDSGSFTFAPVGLTAGEIELGVRAVESTMLSGTLYGQWQVFTFTLEAKPAPTIDTFELANDTGDPEDDSTYDPALQGGISDTLYNEIEGRTIEFDFDGDDVADASTTTDEDGHFELVPVGLSSGSYTIRARVNDSVTSESWTSLEFELLDTTAPALIAFELETDSGAADGITAYPTVVGRIVSNDPNVSIDGVTINLDLDGDPYTETVSDTVTTDEDGYFYYTPENLTNNQVVDITAWVDETDQADGLSVSYTYATDPVGESGTRSLLLTDAAYRRIVDEAVKEYNNQVFSTSSDTIDFELGSITQLVNWRGADIPERTTPEKWDPFTPAFQLESTVDMPLSNQTFSDTIELDLSGDTPDGSFTLTADLTITYSYLVTYVSGDDYDFSLDITIDVDNVDYDESGAYTSIDTGDDFDYTIDISGEDTKYSFSFGADGSFVDGTTVEVGATTFAWSEETDYDYVWDLSSAMVTVETLTGSQDSVYEITDGELENSSIAVVIDVDTAANAGFSQMGNAARFEADRTVAHTYTHLGTFTLDLSSSTPTLSVGAADIEEAIDSITNSAIAQTTELDAADPDGATRTGTIEETTLYSQSTHFEQEYAYTQDGSDVSIEDVGTYLYQFTDAQSASSKTIGSYAKNAGARIEVGTFTEVNTSTSTESISEDGIFYDSEDDVVVQSSYTDATDIRSRFVQSESGEFREVAPNNRGMIVGTYSGQTITVDILTQFGAGSAQSTAGEYSSNDSLNSSRSITEAGLYSENAKHGFNDGASSLDGVSALQESHQNVSTTTTNSTRSSGSETSATVDVRIDTYSRSYQESGAFVEVDLGSEKRQGSYSRTELANSRDTSHKSVGNTSTDDATTEIVESDESENFIKSAANLRNGTVFKWLDGEFVSSGGFSAQTTSTSDNLHSESSTSIRMSPDDGVEAFELTGQFVGRNTSMSSSSRSVSSGVINRGDIRTGQEMGTLADVQLVEGSDWSTETGVYREVVTGTDIFNQYLGTVDSGESVSSSRTLTEVGTLRVVNSAYLIDGTFSHETVQSGTSSKSDSEVYDEGTDRQFRLQATSTTETSSSATTFVKSGTQTDLTGLHVITSEFESSSGQSTTSSTSNNTVVVRDGGVVTTEDRSVADRTSAASLDAWEYGGYAAEPGVGEECTLSGADTCDASFSFDDRHTHEAHDNSSGFSSSRATTRIDPITDSPVTTRSEYQTSYSHLYGSDESSGYGEYLLEEVMLGGSGYGGLAETHTVYKRNDYETEDSWSAVQRSYSTSSFEPGGSQEEKRAQNASSSDQHETVSYQYTEHSFDDSGSDTTGTFDYIEASESIDIQRNYQQQGTRDINLTQGTHVDTGIFDESVTTIETKNSIVDHEEYFNSANLFTENPVPDAPYDESYELTRYKYYGTEDAAYAWDDGEIGVTAGTGTTDVDTAITDNGQTTNTSDSDSESLDGSVPLLLVTPLIEVEAVPLGSNEQLGFEFPEANDVTPYDDRVFAIGLEKYGELIETSEPPGEPPVDPPPNPNPPPAPPTFGESKDDFVVSDGKAYLAAEQLLKNLAESFMVGGMELRRDIKLTDEQIEELLKLPANPQGITVEKMVVKYDSVWRLGLGKASEEVVVVKIPDKEFVPQGDALNQTTVFVLWEDSGLKTASLLDSEHAPIYYSSDWVPLVYSHAREGVTYGAGTPHATMNKWIQHVSSGVLYDGQAGTLGRIELALSMLPVVGTAVDILNAAESGKWQDWATAAVSAVGDIAFVAGGVLKVGNVLARSVGNELRAAATLSDFAKVKRAGMVLSVAGNSGLAAAAFIEGKGWEGGARTAAVFIELFIWKKMDSKELEKVLAEGIENLKRLRPRANALSETGADVAKKVIASTDSAAKAASKRVVGEAVSESSETALKSATESLTRRTFRDLFARVRRLNLKDLNSKEIGDVGESIVREFLEDNGYLDIFAIQNRSGNGIDVVARTRDGLLAFFEVKTSSVGKIGGLSERQQNMLQFVRQVLTDAAFGQGRYRGLDAGTRRNAQTALDLFNAAPQNVRGHVIGVDLLSEIIRVSPWR